MALKFNTRQKFENQEARGRDYMHLYTNTHKPCDNTFHVCRFMNANKKLKYLNCSQTNGLGNVDTVG